MVYEYTR